MPRKRSLMVLMLAPFVALTVCQSAAAQAGNEDPGGQERVQVSPDSDSRAIEIAQSVIERMGGWESWDNTRCLSWRFFGRRMHHWDKWTGDVRIEGPAGDDDYLWLMNVNTTQGRVWKNGEEINDTEELAEALLTGRKVWVNDSYWLVMPYKLLDPGVTLKYSGEREMADGRAADVLKLTFGEGVGYTPENRYEVFVAKDTGLVEQWSFYRNAPDEEPGFTLPWQGWQEFGRIMLATGRGRGMDWEIAVHDELPESVFNSPEPAGD